MPRPPTKKLKRDKNQPFLPFKTRKGDDREATTSGDPSSSTKEVANDKNGDDHEHEATTSADPSSLSQFNVSFLFFLANKKIMKMS